MLGPDDGSCRRRRIVPEGTPVTRPVVLLAEELSPATIEVFGDDADVRHVDGTDRGALLEAVTDADALLVRSATQVDAEVYAAATQLKVVARAGVGLDNVDVPAATSAGVMVINAPTSNITSAAELAVALILASMRNLGRADASVKAGRWEMTVLYVEDFSRAGWATRRLASNPPSSLREMIVEPSWLAFLPTKMVVQGIYVSPFRFSPISHGVQFLQKSSVHCRLGPVPGVPGGDQLALDPA